MKCSCCGKQLGDFVLDKAFTMPDDIWNLNEEDAADVQVHSDLCRLGERYFIRGVAFLPVQDSEESFGWGLWVEVEKQYFMTYSDHYDKDNSDVPAFSGVIANHIPYYPETIGVEVMVQLGTETQRPTFEISSADHPLYNEQAEGVPIQRLHEFNGEINADEVLAIVSEELPGCLTEFEVTEYSGPLPTTWNSGG